MKRFSLISLILLLCCGIVYGVLEEGHVLFTASIPTNRDSVTMSFHTRASYYGCFIGYHEYNEPCVPFETEGELYIPDSITVPDGQRLPVRWISRGSFQGCQNITKIHLPFSIEFISDYSFQDCKSLREITLSDSLQTIYPQAFIGCNALQRIVLRCPHPPYTFDDAGFSEEVRSTATVVLPPASEKEYKTDNVFARFHYHANLLPIYPKQQP